MSATEAQAEDTVDAIADALLTASRLLVSISARSITEVDDALTIAQFRTLVLLDSRGPTNLATLAQRLDVRPSTITRMVDRLVAAGLVDRTRSERSRRELTVALTRRGLAVVREATGRRRVQIGAVVAQMPPEQRVGLIRALTAFTAAGGEPAAERSEEESWS
ncbi:MarR family winged helix-turn-helix transcriptional regulator [Speluncibacter jeojiensis]|uniref:MarR family transcriptional regulator n=1 Tax=Speluncibacter jeojiensis TaxID=2710754 RepID=A0A9X4RI20_9ACTN|nr:MarR family transcriptional regulator [Corynebacteriales bacterium D3-21]